MEAGIVHLVKTLREALRASSFVAAFRRLSCLDAFPPRFVGLDIGFDPDLVRRVRADRRSGVPGDLRPPRRCYWTPCRSRQARAAPVSSPRLPAWRRRFDALCL